MARKGHKCADLQPGNRQALAKAHRWGNLLLRC